ncbi:oxidoreductase, short chain dehydrogenase/reductase family protein [Streptomyces ipomoeae 91-03]|uniref:Oxidoreductase, short chain dehydrogenase/reductase family protein n=1 Tax=Streptomyces ipomoeae 91-03 TaxID=698759 RepID=L1KS66_9ACTN|nr:oxidoreductase, short chain dehydrogenase/reductase family protein [Streptomyces ipomoeae 91-03]
MGASEYSGLTTVVSGGSSDVGLAMARLLTCGTRVARLDLKPDDVPAPPAGIPADVAVRAAVEKAARWLGGIRIPVDNAGIGAPGSIEGNTHGERRRVFEVNVVGIASVPGRRAASAPLPEHGDRQDPLPRLKRRAARPGPVLIAEGRGSLPHSRDRRRHRALRDPSEVRQPRCAPARRWADLSPPTPSRIPRARSPVPPQVLVSPSTAACTVYGSGPASDLPHETVRKENQP